MFVSASSASLTVVVAACLIAMTIIIIISEGESSVMMVIYVRRGMRARGPFLKEILINYNLSQPSLCLSVFLLVICYQLNVDVMASLRWDAGFKPAQTEDPN